MDKDIYSISKKLKDVGAELVISLDNLDDKSQLYFEADLWDVHGQDLIVLLHPMGFGLYKLVGSDGDQVEKVLEFIDQFSNANKSSSIRISSQQEMIDRQIEFAQKHGE